MNKKDIPDIDIDIGNRKDVLNHLDYVNASIMRNNKQERHSTGIYVTDIGNDPRTNLATYDYKNAEELGYIKLDLLNVHVYDKIKNDEHLDSLMNKTPSWNRLWTDKNFCSQIIHIGNYFDILKQMKPDSIERMAMFIALIRPAKKHLIGKSWKEISEVIWDKPETDEFYFKKSHSISYAHLVVVHMNLIEELE